MEQLLTALKRIMYVLIIGVIFYAGGFGWALFFVKDQTRRNRIGMYNILILVAEIIGFLVIAIINISQDPPVYSDPITFGLVNIMLIHLAISFVGMVFYLIWYVFKGNSSPSEESA